MAHCNFHADQHGRWQCMHCNIFYCSTCIVGGHMLTWQQDCPVCKKTLKVSEKKQSTSSIVAYLPQAFLYPFSLLKTVFFYIWMMAVIALTLFTGLMFGMSNILATFFFAIILQLSKIFVYVCIVYLGYLALRLTAQGYMHTDNLFDVMGGRTDTGVKYYIVIIVFFMLISNYMPIDSVLHNLLCCILLNLFLIPCLLLSVFSQRFLLAFHPVYVLRLLWKLGPEYLQVYAVLALINTSAQVFLLFTHSYLLWFSVLLECVFTLYLVLLSSHLAGYIAFRRHDKLGLNIQVDVSDSGKNWKNKRIDEDLILLQVKTLCRQKRIKDAFALLEHYSQRSTSPTLHLKRLNLILLHDDTTFTRDHVMFSLDNLMQHESQHRALCAVIERILAQIPDYAADPEHLYRMIRICYHMKQHVLFQQLCQNFNQAFERHLYRVDILLLQIKAGFYAKSIPLALEKLTALKEQFPTHQRMQDIDNTYQFLNNH